MEVGRLYLDAFMEVVPVNRDVLWYAAVLRASYKSLKLPDAIHLSTAIGLSCTHVLTADTRLPDKVELTHSRYGVVKGPVTLQILRPDAATLRNLLAEPRIA